MSAMKLGSLAPPTYNFTGNSDTLHDEELSFVIGILLQKSTVLNTCRKLDHGYCNNSDFSGRDHTEFFKITHLFVQI
jgi:hypothetical protein